MRKLSAKRLVLLIGFSACCLAPGTGFATDFWHKDPDTGCEIGAKEAPTENDIVSWTGACVGGKAAGEGTLIWMKGDVLHGRYEGGMANGRLHGVGVVLIKAESGEGYDRARSTFVNGEAEGRATFVGANGDYYEGQVRNSKRHGQGMFSDAKGNIYKGRFVDGLPEGRGHSAAIDGEEYLGDFVKGKRHGRGLLIETNGNIYIGEFKDGLASGAGRLESDNGLLIGRFADNEPNGPGTFTDGEGTVYQGQFARGKANGQFLVTKADGTQATQTFKDGEKVE